MARIRKRSEEDRVARKEDISRGDEQRSRQDPRTVFQKNMRDRKRFTPEQMEEAFSARSDQIKDRAGKVRSGLMSPQGRRIGACALLLGLAGAFVAVGTQATSSADAEAAELRTKIEQLKPEQEAAQKEIDETPTVKQAKETLASAKKKGEAVAVEQNAYLDTKPGDTAEVTKISDNLATILGEGTTSKGMDPKTPWYKTNQDVKSAPQGSKEYGWTFESTYSFRGDVATVTWLNRDAETGELLAWAMADYDGSEDSLKNFRSGVTSQGTAYVGATPDKGSENPDPVDPDAPTIGPDDEIGTDGEDL